MTRLVRMVPKVGVLYAKRYTIYLLYMPGHARVAIVEFLNAMKSEIK